MSANSAFTVAMGLHQHPFSSRIAKAMIAQPPFCMMNKKNTMSAHHRRLPPFSGARMLLNTNSQWQWVFRACFLSSNSNVLEGSPCYTRMMVCYDRWEIWYWLIVDRIDKVDWFRSSRSSHIHQTTPYTIRPGGFHQFQSSHALWTAVRPSSVPSIHLSSTAYTHY